MLAEVPGAEKGIKEPAFDPLDELERISFEFPLHSIPCLGEYYQREG